MAVKFMSAAAASAAVLALSAAGFADDTDANPDSKALLEYVKKLESRVSQLESEKEWPLDQVRAESSSALESACRSVNVSGYMEVQYNYNLRHGGASGFRGDTLGFNRGRGPANDESSFDFQNLQLLIEKPLTSVDSTGFRVRSEFGNVSRFANRDANFTAPAHAFNVREAYFDWRMAGWGSSGHTDLTVGKFDSPLGFESLDNANNWQVSRGPAQAFLLPTSLMGVRASMGWSEDSKTTIYVTNGWDTVRDPNDQKSIIVSHEMGLGGSTLTFNLSYGFEGSANGVRTAGGFAGDQTLLLEAMWKAKLGNATDIGVDAIWAEIKNGRFTGIAFTPALGVRTGTRDREVHMIEGYLRHNMNNVWIGARTGWYADNGVGLRGTDITLAVGWDLAEDLSMALEARHDIAWNGNFYSKKSGGGTRVQDVVTASMVYEF